MKENFQFSTFLRPFSIVINFASLFVQIGPWPDHLFCDHRYFFHIYLKWNWYVKCINKHSKTWLDKHEIDSACYSIRYAHRCRMANALQNFQRYVQRSNMKCLLYNDWCILIYFSVTFKTRKWGDDDGWNWTLSSSHLALPFLACVWHCMYIRTFS